MTRQIMKPVVTANINKEVVILRHDLRMIRDAYIEKDKDGEMILVIRQTNISEDGLNPTTVKVFRLIHSEIIALRDLITQQTYE